MFKVIVLALDGSDGSRRAVPPATQLARRDRARIVIAHVEQDVAGKGGAPVPVTEGEIQAEIRRLAEEFGADGIDTSVEMRNVFLGGPAHAIEEIAGGGRLRGHPRHARAGRVPMRRRAPDGRRRADAAGAIALTQMRRQLQGDVLGAAPGAAWRR